MAVLRMRIVPDILAEIKAIDTDTRVTLHYIRSIIKAEKVPVVKAECKKLVDMDRFLEYLSNGDTIVDEQKETGQICRVEL